MKDKPPVAKPPGAPPAAVMPNTRRIELLQDTGVETLKDGATIHVDMRKGAIFHALPHVAARLVELQKAKYLDLE